MKLGKMLKKGLLTVCTCALVMAQTGLCTAFAEKGGNEKEYTYTVTLYAGKEGTAQITATLDDNVSASMTVIVESKANKVSTSPYNHSNSGSSSTYIPRSSWTTGGPGANQSTPNSQESKNALSKAERYYHNQDLSKSQVREQLEFEGYEKDAIDYAMKNLT